MFSSVVVKGKGEARTLGFPSVNFDIGSDVGVEPGIYAATTYIDNQTKQGALCVWPEYNKVEMHILDFEGDLYGRTLEVDILDKVSDFVLVSGIEAARKKIAEDVTKVRTYFA